jgi:hypothetical protein
MRSRTHSTQVNLEQAIAILIQNQAAFLASASELQEWRRRTDDRLARIEHELEQIKTILGELPELIRQKIGFKSK